MTTYSKSAGKKVETAMRELKEGKLKTGTGKKVTNPKQAIAIALSEARDSGAKVPAKKGAAKKSGAKSSGKTASKGAAKKAASKKAVSKTSGKSAAKKTSSKGRK